MGRTNYRLGGIEVICSEKEGLESLCLVPEGMADAAAPAKTESTSALAQLHERGASHRGPYTRGLTMLLSETSYSMRLAGRRQEGGKLYTLLSDGRGLMYEQTLLTQGRALRCISAVRNASDKPVTLDHAASFCISGITPFEEGAAPDCLRLHRFTSFWSCEGRHECQSLEELNFEPTWSKWGVKSLRIGQVGSMPVRGYFPTMAIEDTRRGVTWAASLGWAGSWSMELLRQRDDAALCGGLGGFEDAHWRKTLEPGETLTLPEAVLTVVRGGIDEACDALLDAQRASYKPANRAEAELMPLYNEYLDTWGKPTEESVRAELKALKGMELGYFVIDAGWFGVDRSWDVSTGDWQVRESAFPEGLKAVAEEIRAQGMIPGIWFEAEVANDKSEVLKRRPEMFIHEGGRLVIETNRAFLNLTREDAQVYLRAKVTDFLKDNRFGYVKIDYNNTYGPGFDGFESMGEALRQNTLGVYRFFEDMRKCIPGLAIECCASGGHRLEMSMLERCAMASFSDAHEIPEIPLIAADLHRLVLPRQSQIWAGVRAEDSLQRITWSMCAGTLGRLCLSGQVARLSEEQLSEVRRGLAFYGRVRGIIAEGATRVYRRGVTAYARARGWQAVVREGREGILVTAHAFNDCGESYTLPADFGACEVTETYTSEGCGAEIAGGRLTLSVSGAMCGICVLLKRKRN
ncbi:MAG: alpha-galactosidase [Clostridia bacterium]|nr:alpha-galactosidase [Clostridia bacterium]